MVFSSFLFLFYFLPATLLVYYITPGKFKNLVLVLASIVFYAWGAPNFLILFLSSCLVDYLLVRAIKVSAADLSRQKTWLTLSVIANTGLLLYFKYANFFVTQIAHLRQLWGLERFDWIEVALPIGISFFTFHKISYTIDVYRGKSEPTKSFIDYLLYISLFPQLIAGPIIRYHEIDTQILNRSHACLSFYQGLCRFIIGLGRKLLLADPLAAVADHVFKLSANQLTCEYAWIGVIAYTLQIYFDFSGYSDMAIGLAKMFGFSFPENFNKPYISKSFTEFWRRWHMSLSRWMRDYLYIPLGGNRINPVRTYINLWTVFFISGLWHGAQWTFIVWGLYHGFFLVIERLGFEKLLHALPATIARAWTLLFVMFGWVLFRSPNFNASLRIFSALNPFGEQRVSSIPPANIISNHGITVMIIGLFICLVWESELLEKLRIWTDNRLQSESGKLIYQATILLLFIACFLTIESGNFSPFIYFRF